jgi:hypothetical protein
MIDATLHLQRTYDRSSVTFEVNFGIREIFWKFIDQAGLKTNDYFRLRIDRPFRPRTTGPRSQSARFRGHCEDLAEQLADEHGAPIYTPREIAEAMKRMTVPNGYPTHMSVDGIEEPNSEASLSVEQEAMLLKTQQLYADTHGFWLTEYSDDTPPVPYRSVGGRSRKEMQKYRNEPNGS